MDLTKYLILSLIIAAVVGLSGCMGGEKEKALENFTNESVTVNATPDVAVNVSPDVAVNATSPAITNTTTANMQTIDQIVQITRIEEDASMDPDIGLFESNIVFEVKNTWGRDIDEIDVLVLETECVGEPLIDFGRKLHTFENLTSGKKEEFTITFRKFEGYKSGQKFTCPMSISAWVGTEKTIDVIHFDVIVP